MSQFPYKIFSPEIWVDKNFRNCSLSHCKPVASCSGLQCSTSMLLSNIKSVYTYVITFTMVVSFLIGHVKSGTDRMLFPKISRELPEVPLLRLTLCLSLPLSLSPGSEFHSFLDCVSFAAVSKTKYLSCDNCYSAVLQALPGLQSISSDAIPPWCTYY